MNYQWAAATHRGRVRAHNEDAVYPESAGRGAGPAVLMVADGMGGHVAGDIASRTAITVAAETDGTPAERVEAANRAILDEVAHRPELAGMGTTLTLVELGADGVARFAHVGDSRAYLLRDGRLRQLSTDHTVVAEYVQAGKLTAEEAATHPQRSMLTRALGLVPVLEVDTFEEPLQPGDRLLLCSDGVSSMIDDEQIADALRATTPEEAAWELVERANQAGGLDNITALIADVEP